MENQTNGDLKINGAGNTSGGNFNDVIINGSGNIKGDVDCQNFKSNGTSDINGNLKAKTIRVNGTATITGNINSEDIKINGTVDVKGMIESKVMKIHGAMTITGNICSDELQIHGGLRISGDCNAENFESRGGFTVVGLLNADNINIRLHAPCKAKEIGGEKIIVKLGNDFGIAKFIKTIFSSFDLNRKLSTDIIEGDDIEIEYTKAKIVRGNNITIGDGCEIELVEYRNNLYKQGKSSIKEEKKV